MADNSSGAASRYGYSGLARFFHWLTFFLILGLFPVGFYMTHRGKTLNLWDDLTNQLYSTHKLVGFILLILIVLRLLYRTFAGAPEEEPTLTRLQAMGSNIVHWALYALLIAVPVSGWVGISAFPALGTLGGLSLPGIVAPNKELASQAFAVHGILTKALLALVVLHVAAALFHHFVRRDSVLTRMTSGRMRDDT